MQNSPKIILGIDPGTLMMGYSIIAATPRQITVLDMDVLRLSNKKDHYERLQLIHHKITSLIVTFKPQYFAIEAPFFGKNVQSMLKLGRAQGVAIAAAMGAGLTVYEYSPKKVKQSITGNGNADKDQVWKMLQTILKLQDTVISNHDISDALAVAVCHHYQERMVRQDTGSKVKGWGDFIKANPGRVKKQE
ncbi:crossover junction endodeoxyribonuclease RuvC [Paraflavitalea soli]|uniref:Crossover junction endodeoxyribonuclease RuvC n=1 Tax=Paraflavitalea soli TaxID=2315862 RepID=A0A3B7NAN5_9BACT|nr:crossover junction endodeoxyribonuclease RuvC [Paraflavitalea soli]